MADQLGAGRPGPYLPRSHVFLDDTAGHDDGAVAHGDAGHDIAMGTDEAVLPDANRGSLVRGKSPVNIRAVKGVVHIAKNRVGLDAGTISDFHVLVASDQDMVTQGHIVAQHNLSEPMGTEQYVVAQNAAITKFHMTFDLKIGGQELTVLPHPLEALCELPPAQSLHNSHSIESFALYFTHQNRHGTTFSSERRVERRIRGKIP